jgi:hypothetical protein
MIAFGCSITTPETFERLAAPGIRRAAEPGSEVFAHAAAGSVARSYNLMLELAAARDDLEALVLVHQDAEIADARLCSKLRDVLADPDVGVVGCVGAVGAPTIAWWEGSVTWEAFARAYPDLRGRELPALSFNRQVVAASQPLGEVETLDGFVLALAPWAVRTLRFDEALSPIHGYDFDLCLQVRERDRKVVAADLDVIHHHSVDLVTDSDAWIEAHMLIAEKWDGRGNGQAVNGDWKARARRSEAEAGVARLAGESKRLQAQARIDEHLKPYTDTLGWRLTEPLRQFNATRRARSAPQAPARPGRG